MCGKYVTSSVQWWKVPVTKVLCLKGYSTTLNCVPVFAKTYKHSLMHKKLPFNSSFEVFALHMMTIGDRINGSFCVFLAASKTFFFFFFSPWTWYWLWRNLATDPRQIPVFLCSPLKSRDDKKSDCSSRASLNICIDTCKTQQKLMSTFILKAQSRMCQITFCLLTSGGITVLGYLLN